MRAAITQFVSDPSFFGKLKQQDIPVLVTNGKDDTMTPTSNSWLLQQALKDVELQAFQTLGMGIYIKSR